MCVCVCVWCVCVCVCVYGGALICVRNVPEIFDIFQFILVIFH